ncbi:MAG TPA: HD domain-containing protein, partial [Burkholderiales bacterium]|nr:HD domain-containing protein [Burkholderiales bacterium]
MVTVTIPREGTDISDWLKSLSQRCSPHEIDTLLQSGEHAFDHAIQVASILAGMHLDCETITAGLLLHCGEGLQQEGVKNLVEGVMRFSSFDRAVSQNGDLEGLRKMLLAIVEDIRVVLIKLADELQNLRHLAAAEDSETRLEAAVETRDIYAPLANRLGIWQIKWELEDLSFRILEPEIYKKIAKLLDEKRLDREKFIGTAVSELKTALEKAGIAGEISGRPKHIYSIYKKMQRKNLGFEGIYDVRAIRVLVRDVKDCYAVLGIVHDIWAPIPGEFDDYIAKPKE